jgi:uncharacterized RDD family membrane protein YckC
MSATEVPGSSASEPSAAPINLRAPSLFKRLACWMYEGVLMFGVVFISGYLFSALTQTRHAMENRHSLQIFLFIVFGIYFVWLWSKGQTLAMKTWHIRITDAKGKPISQARALLRYVLCYLWFFPPLAVGYFTHAQGGAMTVLLVGWVLIYSLISRFHAQKQFLHDALAGTRLVDAPRLP